MIFFVMFLFVLGIILIGIVAGLGLIGISVAWWPPVLLYGLGLVIYVLRPASKKEKATAEAKQEALRKMVYSQELEHWTGIRKIPSMLKPAKKQPCRHPREHIERGGKIHVLPCFWCEPESYANATGDLPDSLS